MPPKPDYLHNHPDFADLIRIVAEQKGIAPPLVEKDYWIMHCLHGLQQLGLGLLALRDFLAQFPVRLLEFLGAFRLGDSFVKSLDGDEVRAIPLVRGRVSGFQLDRRLKLALGRGTVPVPAKVDESQGRMRFC